MTSIFLSRHLFLKSDHIMSPQNITIPFLLILRRKNLILSGGLVLSVGQFDGCLFFFPHFTGSICGNVTNLILGIYIYIFKRKIISILILSREIVSLIPRLKDKEPHHENVSLSPMITVNVTNVTCGGCYHFRWSETSLGSL